MQPDFKNNKIIYNINKLSAVFFENYSVSSVTLSSKDKNGYFGNFKNENFIPKLEAKITEKVWKEIPNIFPDIKLGNYFFKEDTFTAIVTINNKLSEDTAKRILPKIIAGFKSRSTILLNQFHGKHGRIFWENTYEEKNIRDLDELQEILNSHH
jgi:hypothetical protein